MGTSARRIKAADTTTRQTASSHPRFLTPVRADHAAPLYATRAADRKTVGTLVPTPSITAVPAPPTTPPTAIQRHRPRMGRPRADTSRPAIAPPGPAISSERPRISCKGRIKPASRPDPASRRIARYCSRKTGMKARQRVSREGVRRSLRATDAPAAAARDQVPKRETIQISPAENVVRHSLRSSVWATMPNRPQQNARNA